MLFELLVFLFMDLQLRQLKLACNLQMFRSETKQKWVWSKVYYAEFLNYINFQLYFKAYILKSCPSLTFYRGWKKYFIKNLLKGIYYKSSGMQKYMLIFKILQKIVKRMSLANSLYLSLIWFKKNLSFDKKFNT